MLSSVGLDGGVEQSESSSIKKGSVTIARPVIDDNSLIEVADSCSNASKE
jgi:hypothetical protein